MVGSPPLFTAIPSTSAMMIASDISSSCHDIVGHTEGWMSPKKDAMEGIPTDLTALTALPGTPSPQFVENVTQSTEWVDQFKEEEQTWFVRMLLSRMHHHQHGSVNSYLKPMLQRDFITLLPKKGLDHVAEAILGYLDAKSLCAAGAVSKEWARVISEGMLWKKLIERKVNTDSLWKGLADRRNWIQYLFKPKPGESHPPHSFYRGLYPSIIKDIDTIENNWRCGKHNLQRINCRSENSKGVYCLQYDDSKIVSGLRDNTIKMWDRQTLQQYSKVLTGHTGSVLCLQYDDKVIISGSSDSTVRVWDVETGEMINTLIHHCEAVLHLSFNFKNGMMVTCSRDRTIKVWSTSSCEFVRTLNGHKRGIACLQYHDRLVVSGSSDNTIRLWDIECGACLRTLEGHEELVRCIRFDSKRIVSGAYDGKIKVWDLQAAMDPRAPAGTLCIRTLVEHSGRVFRLQFDEFQIVSSSHDDTILIWEFLNCTQTDSNPS